MNIKIDIKPNNTEPYSFSYDEMIKDHGIYKREKGGCPDSRFMITNHGNFFVFGQFIEPMDDSWKPYRFVKTKERITITFGD